MKILVTGLCLSRNLGGPAMAIVLVNELKKRLPQVGFTFAVPTIEFKVEQEWAARYGFNIVRKEVYPMHVIEKLRIPKILALIGLTKKSFAGSDNLWTEVHHEYMNAMGNSDLVIDMSGISYVGDSSYRFLGGLSSFSDFRYASNRNIPFARFIQTFGPFENREVRFFAKREFKKLDFIPARGKKSAAMCREMTDRPEKVYDFPDIAIRLSPETGNWTKNYLSKKKLNSFEYLVISPSTVINNIPERDGACVGKNYLQVMYEAAKYYLTKNPGKKVLLLPHMYSYIKSESDRECCYQILELSKKEPEFLSRIEIVEEDIDPMQAKALIANAEMSLVSRYHALVASLSSGTPAIAIGWNVKYEDLLEYYEMNHASFDARTHNSKDLAEKIFRKLDEFGKNDLRPKLLELQKQNEKKVAEAFELLVRWINKHSS